MDPVLGVFTGVFAYYLYESNPRTAPPEGDRLVQLLKWKRDKSQKEKAALADEDSIDWKALASEMEKK